MKAIIIQGSSRSKGNTSKVTHILAEALSADVMDLSIYKIHHYSYEHDHLDDDFIPLLRRILEYDTLIFATPVYWYAMSGIMKNFIDRITDCLQVEKDLGRKLRGKNLAAISCGSEDKQVYGFFVPFQLSAAYLGMHYLGDLHTWVDGGRLSREVKERMSSFIHTIKKVDGYKGNLNKW